MFSYRHQLLCAGGLGDILFNDNVVGAVVPELLVLGVFPNRLQQLQDRTKAQFGRFRLQGESRRITQMGREERQSMSKRRSEGWPEKKGKI